VKKYVQQSANRLVTACWNAQGFKKKNTDIRVAETWMKEKEKTELDGFGKCSGESVILFMWNKGNN
jgi:hypothetical protein